ncbi:methyltransferase-like protein 22 [Adelges cooleyi]|uniref:methyltransferase-like protein 22 n=1 Tax=Adelges cooleyi TaxID=133065 RepID=UPI0021804028|nr:methyltransferase-like protein 22 [Adelges cooleyi]XP_050441514.1 methyltransferase-like protein 22 [Adelges cooleyi]
MAENIYTVQSEVYQEMNEEINDTNIPIRNVRSLFKFKHRAKPDTNEIRVDEDGDLVIERHSIDRGVVIEHINKSPLDMVGMQVWRSALLMSDFIMNRRDVFNKDQVVLELGSGVGLTGIVSAMHCKETIFTDIDNKDILSNIEKNIKLNEDLITGRTIVMPLDFFEPKLSEPLWEKFKTVTIIIATDVVYDNELTKQFVNTLIKLMTNAQTAYVAMEKRYVFSTSDLDVCAPCYDYFVELLNENESWIKVELINCNFTQYFQYNRAKELVLFKLTVQHEYTI